MMKKYGYPILMFISLVALGELLLSTFAKAQRQSAWSGVASLLRNEINSSNSYQIARSLSDFEKVGLIKCVVLTEASNDERIYYDTTSQSYCGLFADRNEDILQSINGTKWELSFSVPTSTLWLILRVLLPIVVLLAEYLLIQYFRNYQRTREAERLKAHLEKTLLIDLTKQTSHDIASPLSLLKMIGTHPQVPIEVRSALQQVSERIDRIFHDLRAIDDQSVSLSPKLILQSLSVDELIYRIADEKRKEWDLTANCLETKISSGVVIGNVGSLERALSNILNNALEATSSVCERKIVISSRIEKRFIVVEVQDNGCGIPTSLLSKIGSKGFSHGKSSSSNSGIGIFSARNSIESFGGSLVIESIEQVGTKVSLYLKSAS